MTVFTAVLSLLRRACRSYTFPRNGTDSAHARGGKRSRSRHGGRAGWAHLAGALSLHPFRPADRVHARLDVRRRAAARGGRARRHVEDEARRRGLARVVLGVNKSNEKALRAYRRNGYAVREAVKKDIGGGFFMDDFIMEKVL